MLLVSLTNIPVVVLGNVRYRLSRSMAVSRAVARLWLLLILARSTTFLLSNATIDEGSALYSMMVQWKASFSTWTAAGDPCLQGWENVTCNLAGNVVKLNVSNRGLIGGLPQEIGQLRYLQVLDISNYDKAPATRPENFLTGPMPDSLSNCVDLMSLNVSNLPWTIPFPAVIGKLLSLEELSASSANFSGIIPDQFFQLRRIRTVFLGTNSLTNSPAGNLLDSFGNFKSLEILSVNSMNWSQPIPAVLGTLPNLTYFNCHHCYLYGGLPESWSSLRNLQNLTLHVNTLTGNIPDSWKQIRSMRNFRIDTNYFYGPFPVWMFSEWPLLDSVYLSRNVFYSLDAIPSIPTLDQEYNISFRFNILRWDCNYLQGISPCTNEMNPCGPRILFKTQQSGTFNGQNSSFNFILNCYSDSSKQAQDGVALQCGASHTLYCSDFYNRVIAGLCPDCPVRQEYVSPASRNCICGYPGLVGVQSSKSSKGVSIGAVVGGVLGLALLFAIILWLVVWKRRKHFTSLDVFQVKKDEGDVDNWEVPSGLTQFRLQDLAKITDDFSEKHVIGAGGFGKVYSGTLGDGRMVAIKRASGATDQGLTAFRNEVTLLSRLHHRHLVHLLGFCAQEDFQILVYEFMPNGSLSTHLRGTKDPLHCYKRLEIAHAVAQGLEYLHSFADPPVIHRDVKPSNILLDEHMVAKLADFGLSKESAEFQTHVSTNPAGTAGYLDPEYFMRRQLTTASDVYAFGVVLLELITGQAAIDHKREEDYNLVEWANAKLATGGISAIIDPFIQDEYSVTAFSALADLALNCAAYKKVDRPNMKTVLANLEPLFKLQAQITPAATVKAGARATYESSESNSKSTDTSFGTFSF